MKMWIATYVETSDTCDGKARVLGVYNSKEECLEEIKSDMLSWREAHKDEGCEIDVNKMCGHFDYDTTDGCEWNVEEVELPIPTDDKIKATEQILIDNGVDEDEANTVLQAVGYALLDTELYPEE